MSMSGDRSTDVGDMSPSSLAHLIGQRSVVEQVRVALDAAHQDAKKFDHALLVGPAGCGKTQTAKIIAAEMGQDCVEVLGQSLDDPAAMNSALLSTPERGLLFIDEAHELPKPQQVALYLAIDQRKILLPGTRKNGAPIGVPLADFSVLLATTDEYQLLQPLRDRMRLVLRFTHYDEMDLVRLVALRSQALGWWVEGCILPQIARRSRGTPRLALRLLQSCHRVCRADGEDRILPRHFLRACELEQIDPLGLDVTQQQYITFLADGPVRLNVLASLLGLPVKTVADVVEPFLIRVGLVTKDDQGRRE